MGKPIINAIIQISFREQSISRRLPKITPGDLVDTSKSDEQTNCLLQRVIL